jgi:cytochrome o ubiquinol oxidase subunit 1
VPSSIAAVSVPADSVLRVYPRPRADRDLTGDPWDGRTLEWDLFAAAFYNFATLPEVTELDDFWERKKKVKPGRSRPSTPTSTCRATPARALSSAPPVFGFAMIWHIWWLAIVGFVGMIATFIYRTFDEDVDYYVPAAEVERIENEHRKHEARLVKRS